jgi:hypothetical protein
MLDATRSSHIFLEALVCNELASFFMIFILFLENVKAPLTAKAVAGRQGVPTLPWTHLAKVLSERGVYISGWPFGVEFPDEIKRPPGKKSQGLKDLPAASVRAMVLACEMRTLTFNRTNANGT